jgi:glucose-6-phosphate 1-dehydrogenase
LTGADDGPRTDPTALIILGAGGDLTWRKLIPALHALHCGGWLNDRLAVVGLDSKSMSDDAFRDHLRDGVEHAQDGDEEGGADWETFADRLTYHSMDFNDREAFETLSDRLDELGEAWGAPPNRIFYLAVPPALVGTIVDQLQATGLNRPEDRVRIVVEKPFGRDLDSARELNARIAGSFAESQVYRIDHYLGKETVQNILAFRFANGLFEPIWDRRYIDHVQITVGESLGVEHRGEYYDQAGALRDMVQNHLLQVLSLIAMEAPVSFDADEIRSKKIDVLHAVRPIGPADVHRFASRGQYGEGWMRGDHVRGYREEPGVDPHSKTETFVALKLFVDNWRWNGVPFYLRTGKRLPDQASVASIQFHPVPHQSFPSDAISDWQPNRMMIHIQPDQGITLRFLVQRPELQVRLSPAEMRFDYREAFDTAPPAAYETLLLDVISGDQTLFKRAEQVEAAWQVVTPVLEDWQASPPVELPNYAAGTWGPESAEILIAQDGRRWFKPSPMGNDPCSVKE